MDRTFRVFVSIVILVIFNAIAEKIEEPKLCIKNGCLIGLTETSRLGRQYYSFLGIPFAKPPINKLRFKPPERPEPWDTLDAKQDGNICPQSILHRSDDDRESNEDCLYLNVYTPQIPDEIKSKKLLPVIVIFHPGGFQYWSGTRKHFPGNYFMDRDVVIVSINYRLNIFGFLSTEDEVSPGNYGLKDQRLALEWVQENIATFGGDPDCVTIQGHDAGAASVHLHTLSPSSKGLFHRAIAQSGNALAPWVLSFPYEAREHAFYLGKHLKCPIENSSILVECLRWKSTEELMETDLIFFVWNIDPLIPWKPSVEPEHEGAFLTKRPIELLEGGNFFDVPLLTGVTSHEGLFRAAGIVEVEHILMNWNALAIKSYTSALNLYHLPIEELQETIIKLREFYFETDTVEKKHINQFTDMISDRYFYHPMAKSIRLQLEHKKNPIFVYKFDYKTTGDITFANIFSFIPDDETKYEGLCHNDDLALFYPVEKTFFNNSKQDDQRNAMIDRTLDLWINFVTHGNPTPEEYKITWNSVESKDVEYLSINGPNDLKMTQSFLNERFNFWEDLKLERDISEHDDFLIHDEL